MRDYYGLAHRAQQGSTTVMAIAIWPWHRKSGRPGVGVNPLRGQNNVQGSCDMDRFRTNCPAISIFPVIRRARRRSGLGVKLDKNQACASQHV